MIDKNVIFKKVEMKEGSVASSMEVKGQVMDKYDDWRLKDGHMANHIYYLIVDDDGVLHQVRPFNILKIVK
jgi:hypothetical protein